MRICSCRLLAFVADVVIIRNGEFNERDQRERRKASTVRRYSTSRDERAQQLAAATRSQVGRRRRRPGVLARRRARVHHLLVRRVLHHLAPDDTSPGAVSNLDHPPRSVRRLLRLRYPRGLWPSQRRTHQPCLLLGNLSCRSYVRRQK